MFARLIPLAAMMLAGCASVDTEARSVAQDRQAFLDTCEDWDEWEKPAPPFRIYGNSYYVGTCGIAAILITGEDGHVLIDGGSRGGGPLVEASIRQLGYRIEDVKTLLHSHEHFDHVGGLAYLQRKSGAQLVASHGAAKALESGEVQPDDPQYGMEGGFEPITVARKVRSFEAVSLGKIALLPLTTPGHTSGALSWSWWSCEKTDCKVLVYADSLSPVSSETYRYGDHPEYIESYRAGLKALADLPCDIVITPHPSASQMLARMQDEDGLVDKAGCRSYASGVEARLAKRLSDEVGAE
ncbi:subclass B3 metallo-beta-lactamase [Altererythrobacter arenosus]|uniref:Subclass B3 metallo-beta-lactamase n=1 Tax=Altererythrobacter arenosus TaxID=3032592 RepID=A0ABY8FQF4_9SPHN|nr:subclass B3 metallo-beta-lactamase [Altererythrobacter sp. CAU 1644]WFL77249.1 subclass B3 metallo-beta-lactamase [Altererythrobacter sp. CAU 1644]